MHLSHAKCKADMLRHGGQFFGGASLFKKERAKEYPKNEETFDNEEWELTDLRALKCAAQSSYSHH
eukprot:394373-Karenia_brevis.AAC.1